MIGLALIAAGIVVFIFITYSLSVLDFKYSEDYILLFPVGASYSLAAVWIVIGTTLLTK